MSVSRTDERRAVLSAMSRSDLVSLVLEQERIFEEGTWQLKQEFRETWNAEKRALDRQMERAEKAEAVVVRYREALERVVAEGTRQREVHDHGGARRFEKHYTPEAAIARAALGDEQG